MLSCMRVRLLSRTALGLLELLRRERVAAAAASGEEKVTSMRGLPLPLGCSSETLEIESREQCMKRETASRVGSQMGEVVFDRRCLTEM
jgi:hypothetical protein